MDAICLIAGPRTGTRHLSEVLKNVPDLAPYLDVFDLENGTSGIDVSMWPALREATGIDFQTIRDSRLSAFMRSQPGEWLDALERLATRLGKRQFSFRLMRPHLDDQTLMREIMPRHGLRVILVVRKQIDAYASLRKAIELGRWRDVDTTGMRLVLEADPFARWLDEQQRWYDMWRSHLERHYMPVPVVRYELDIDQPPERVIRRFAAAAGQIGVTIRTPGTIANQGLIKQDRAKTVFEKVTNWAEFNREVFALGLERRAFGYPL